MPDEPEIVEGEIVEGERADEDAQQRPAVVVLQPVVQVVQIVQVVARHPAARSTGRHAAYVPLGALVVGRRAWDSRTTARYDRNIRSAEAAGDQASALEWEERRARFLRERHARRVAVLELTGRTLVRAPRIAGGVIAGLGVTGLILAFAHHNPRYLAVPFDVAAAVMAAAALAVSVSWGPFLLAAPWVAVAALHEVGRRHANAASSGWLAAAKADGEGTGIVVTADTIVVALQNLDKIPALRKAVKDGWRPTFHLQPVRDGRGYSAVFSAPLGVTPEMIADQRPVLARNVHRAEIEVWPSDAAAAKGSRYPAGSVAMWIADPGVLSAAAPEYPLLHDGQADVFEGVPAGISPRGDEVLVPVVGNNFVAGGQMGQGKSNACRVVMLGCATDPLPELDVFVFANNGDFDAYAPRLHIYRKGVEDATVQAAVARLQELYEEVGRREGRLAELGAKKVTRGLAEANPDMRPVVALFSECHELFGHDEHGARAAELAIKTAKRARKTAITLLFDTQSSRKEAIPPALVELVSVNCCFYVKTWRSNDGFLGDGSFAAGIRATELRPGRDRGTSVITGVSEAQFELLRWYFIEVDDDTGFDAAADVIARSVERAAQGLRLGGSALPAIEARDLLGDLGQVLGTERVNLADVPALLRELAPTWGPYRNLRGTGLRDLLKAEGVRVTFTGGVLRLDPADLRDVLGRRERE